MIISWHKYVRKFEDEVKTNERDEDDGDRIMFGAARVYSPLPFRLNEE